MIPDPSTIRVEDDCAGPGGWDVAAELLGLRPIGYESDAAACATARAAGHVRVQTDMTLRRPSLDLLNRSRRFYLYIASPPCQGFSLAGLGAGRLDAAQAAILDAVEQLGEGATYADVRHVIRAATVSGKRPDGDDRVPLVVWPLAWALRMHPENIAWEQVPAVLPIWEACASVLRADGYSVATGNLQAEQYDTPQTRKRAILIASRTHNVALPEPVRRKYRKGVLQGGAIKGQEHLRPWLSMADTLGWGMTARPSMTVTGGGSETGGAEPFGNAARQGIGREQSAGRWGAKPLASGSGAARAVLEETVAGRWREPGNAAEWQPTLAHPVGSFAPDVVAAPGYRKAGDGPRQNAKGSVRVTVQEAAILQGFPADYPWQGTKTAQYRQVGDAVPPPLAWHVLRAALAMPVESYPGVADTLQDREAATA